MAPVASLSREGPLRAPDKVAASQGVPGPSTGELDVSPASGGATRLLKPSLADLQWWELGGARALDGILFTSLRIAWAGVGDVRLGEAGGDRGRGVSVRDVLLDQDLVLMEIVRRLVGAYRPECVHLFGSKARGDADSDSDYDPLVVIAADARMSPPPCRQRCSARGGSSMPHDPELVRSLASSAWGSVRDWRP